MCGRFDFSPRDILELEEIVEEIERRNNKPIKTGEIFPTDCVPTLKDKSVAPMSWGFPKYTGKGVLINARSETITEKPTFRQSVLTRRCVIPCSGYYEWSTDKNGQKKKYKFTSVKDKVLYLAGIYNIFKDDYNLSHERFVIITTDANQYVNPIHQRMPVVLKKDELDTWFNDKEYFVLFDRDNIKLNYNLI